MNGRLTRASLALLTATAFFTPLSSSLAYLALAGLVVCTITDTARRGSWRADLALLRAHPLVLATMALLVWVALSTFWSAAPGRAAWSQWARYLPMLIVPIAIVVLNRPGVTGDAWVRIWMGFGAAMVLTVLLSYCSTVWPFQLHWPVGPDNPAVFKHYIIQGVFSSLLVAGCVAGVIALKAEPASTDHASKIMALLLIAVASAWSIVGLLPGKTGLLALVVALLPLPFCMGSKRVQWSAVGLVMAGVTAVVLIPGAARDQTLATLSTASEPATWTLPSPEGIQDLPDRQASTLLRAKYLAISADMIADNPVLGVGARSYQREFCARAGHAWCDLAQANSAQPHNQLVLFLDEQGLIGGLLFVLWCVAPLLALRASAAHSAALRPKAIKGRGAVADPGLPIRPEHRYLLLATVGVFVVHSLLDSTLHLNTEGLMYPLLLAVLVSGTRQCVFLGRGKSTGQRMR